MKEFDKNKLRQQIQNEIDMLVGCKNRMCITDDEMELAEMYTGLILYAANLYRMNLKRIRNTEY